MMWPRDRGRMPPQLHPCHLPVFPPQRPPSGPHFPGRHVAALAVTVDRPSLAPALREALGHALTQELGAVPGKGHCEPSHQSPVQ